MAVQGSALHTDTDGKRTSAVWADDGAGTSRWLLWARNAVLEALKKAEDSAHTTADTGIPALAVRRDTAAVGSDTDGDYSTLNVDSSGRLYVNTGSSAVTALEDSPANSGDGGVPAFAVRRDTAASSSGADGDYSTLNVDANGRLYVIAAVDRTSSSSPSVTASSALADDLVVKASAGRLYRIVGYVASGADGYLQVHDSATQPADTAVPELSYFVPAASTTQSFNLELGAHECSTGITLVWSTTGATLTAGGASLFATAYYS